MLADSIDNSISDDSLASLIRMPGGCVEQNLATITLPLIATLYLERTEGWESVGVQKKAEALRYIRRGERPSAFFRGETKHRSNDRSFSGNIRRCESKAIRGHFEYTLYSPESKRSPQSVTWAVFT